MLLCFLVAAWDVSMKLSDGIMDDAIPVEVFETRYANGQIGLKLGKLEDGIYGIEIRDSSGTLLFDTGESMLTLELCQPRRKA